MNCKFALCYLQDAKKLSIDNQGSPKRSFTGVQSSIVYYHRGIFNGKNFHTNFHSQSNYCILKRKYRKSRGEARSINWFNPNKKLI